MATHGHLPAKVKRGRAGKNERPEWPAEGGRGQSGQLAVGGAAAFVTPFGRKPARRAELPHPAAPVTDRLRCPPYQPVGAPVHEDQADGPTRAAQSPR